MLVKILLRITEQGRAPLKGTFSMNFELTLPGVGALDNPRVTHATIQNGEPVICVEIDEVENANSFRSFGWQGTATFTRPAVKPSNHLVIYPPTAEKKPMLQSIVSLPDRTALEILDKLRDEDEKL